MPLFGSGRTYNPYASDSPAAKRRRLHEAEGVLTATGFPEIAGALETVADVFEGDQVVPGSSFRALPSSGRGLSTRRPNKAMPFRRRRWRRRRRRTFNSKVGSALLKFAETKREVDSVAQQTFSAGDGITRVLYIASPVGNILQGTGGDGHVGDAMWIKAIWVRGRISLDQTTNSLRVRILVISTQQFADLPTGFTTYGNTTTATTNPAQTAADQESNIRIFETSAAELAAQPSAPYVGNASGIDIIDSDLIRVHGGREYFLSQQHLLNFQNVDIFVPINKKWRNYSEFDVDVTDQMRSFKDRNYYVILQVFSNSNANNILAAQDILGTFDLITYFKDI